MKKLISIFCAVIILTMALVGCGKTAATTEIASENVPMAATPEGDNSISIVTTIFPEYDWVKEILGDNPAKANVTMLLDNGVDLHSYQPTAEDIMKIATCDLFIYVGGESDEWVEDALKEATNKNMVVVNLLDVLGDSVKEEEMIEGMQEEEHEHEEDVHEHEEDEHEHEHEDGEIEYDEHVWLSLKNAEKLCDHIKDALVSIDADNATLYEENATAYAAKLKALDKSYESTVNASSVDTLLFGDRFPFRYLVDDYSLKYYAAFVGCSAETEASFETITFLSGKVDELSLHSIMTIESGDRKIAETIKDNTSSKDQQILTLDSMQSTTSKDVKNGATYLGTMKSNLEILKEALK